MKSTVIERCSVCKKIEGRSYVVPHSPSIPEFRLADKFAFSRVGVVLRVLCMYVSDIFAKRNEQSLHSLIHMRYKPSCSF